MQLATWSDGMGGVAEMRMYVWGTPAIDWMKQRRDHQTRFEISVGPGCSHESILLKGVSVFLTCNRLRSCERRLNWPSTTSPRLNPCSIDDLLRAYHISGATCNAMASPAQPMNSRRRSRRERQDPITLDIIRSAPPTLGVHPHLSPDPPISTRIRPGCLAFRG